MDRERPQRVPEPAEFPAEDKVLQERALAKDHGRCPKRQPHQSSGVEFRDRFLR